jgi:hypothetical protein
VNANHEARLTQAERKLELLLEQVRQVRAENRTQMDTLRKLAGQSQAFG